MKKVVILGSTGSIGTSALDFIKNRSDDFEVIGLAEGHDVKLLAEQIQIFRPKLVSVRDRESSESLKNLLVGHKPKVLFGMEGTCEVASMADADIVLSAIVGSIGLKPTLAALSAGKDVALANKESLVVGGKIVVDMVKRKKLNLLPVDSEHSAIFQSLCGNRKSDLKKIVLTASGGPFRGYSRDKLKDVTVEDALKHPRWNMGRKITIDSATLMNKALEIIEAKWLFDLKCEQIDVIVHPQSIIHSMVEYKDGCVIAQLGVPDMRAPIAYALTYPQRSETGVDALDLIGEKGLTFEKPDTDVFPAINYAYDAILAGDTMPAVLNAANEVAVSAFLDRKINFLRISELVRMAMDDHRPYSVSTLEDLLEADKWAREYVEKTIKENK